MTDARADFEALTVQHYESLEFRPGQTVINVHGPVSAAYAEELRRAFREQAGLDVLVRIKSA